MVNRVRRREFLQAAGSALCFAPAIVTASKTKERILVGSGEHRYEVIHDWPQLPDRFTWQTTHNVAVDKGGNLYVIHEGHRDKADHPAVFVFDSEGRYVDSFGEQFQGGGHGLEVHAEEGEEFLYITAYQTIKTIAKLTLQGEPVWTRHAPMEAGCYAAGEDRNFEAVFERDRFMPTNIAFHPTNGDFFVADGYGAYVVHRYDREANYLSTFGEVGKQEGQFDTPHGVWVDARPGREPSLIVADRANGRLQWFTFDGQHLQTLDGFLLPANIDCYGDILVVPDLRSRITLLDADNRVIAHLGDDETWRDEVFSTWVRSKPNEWRPGMWIHPHDACFDAEGNLYVAEWVATGRVSKLRRVS
jgi:hypothetical protein